jgi:anti-sigma regulatory factor (Ser/Thr protein kinase)/ActR/RegA family two-component response regulator
VRANEETARLLLKEDTVATILPFPGRKPNPRTVLLIEPFPETNAELLKIFDSPAWRVSFADDNETGMEMARAETFDLIITNAATTCTEDILMLRALRMMRPHTRMIVVTKEKLPGDILRAIQNHAFSYFTLPIALEDLRDLIEHVLQQPAWDDGIEMLQGTQEYVVLAVRCDLGTLDRLMQFMRASASLPEVECEEVAFAFREIMLNAIEYGGKFDPNKFVEICYLKTKRMVMCRVKDPGEGFSLKEIEDAEIAGPLVTWAKQAHSEKVTQLPPRGFGILMARRFVDDLVFSAKGNEAFLIKYLPAATRADSI